MTKSKNTKKALLASCLSMLLCVAMLVGSTFAWFTDSVTTGVNKIVAGNLDVELEYKDSNGKWQSAKDTTSLFRPTDGEDATLWEPGHTEYVEMRIRNAGSLALKYNFELNVSGDNEFKNVYGNQVKLSNFLVFNKLDTLPEEVKREDLWIVDQEAEKAAMGTSALAKFEKTDDKLLPDETLEFVLAVYMPTWVGNEANYPSTFFMGINATRKPEISLGFTLFATQDTVEKDSFDDQYDAKAWLGEAEEPTYDADTMTWSVNSAAQLAWISENVETQNNFTGKTVKLTDNIDLNNMTWTPIEEFNGTFDGNNKTILNLKVDKSDNNAGLFGHLSFGGHIIIKDVIIQNANIAGKECVGVLAGYIRSADNITNIKVYDAVVNGSKFVGGIAGYALTDFDNCAVENIEIKCTQNGGGIVGFYAENSNTIEYCTVKNANISAIIYAGGIVGALNGPGCTPSIINNTLINTKLGTSNNKKIIGRVVDAVPTITNNIWDDAVVNQ